MKSMVGDIPLEPHEVPRSQEHPPESERVQIVSFFQDKSISKLELTWSQEHPPFTRKALSGTSLVHSFFYVHKVLYIKLDVFFKTTPMVG